MIVTTFPRAVRNRTNGDSVERRYDPGGPLTILGGTLDPPVRQRADAQLAPLPEAESAPPEKPTILHRVICGSSASTASVWNWARSINRSITSRRMTLSAQWPSCDGSRRGRGMPGKSASKPGCACHARAMPSCCRQACAPLKAPTKSAVANGIVPSLEISYDDPLPTFRERDHESCLAADLNIAVNQPARPSNVRNGGQLTEPFHDRVMQFIWTPPIPSHDD